MSVSYIVDNLEVNFIIILFLLLIFASFAGQERYKASNFFESSSSTVIPNESSLFM